MRAFIGIDFEENTKNAIRDLQQDYREAALKGRWKHHDNFHITLKFLREVNAGQQKLIDESMAEINLTEPAIF